MIKEIFILHRESGVPLIHINFFDKEASANDASVLFSGALHGIRTFLKECKIGDLTSFTTQENRIEVRCDEGIVIAMITDINYPPQKKINIIIEDIGALFVSLYESEIEFFNGNLTPFESFEPELIDFINVQLEEEPISKTSNLFFTSLKDENVNAVSNNHLNLIADWIKNRFDPSAGMKFNENIVCPPNNSSLEITILLEGGERHMNRIDKWLSKRIPYGGTKNVIFVIELGLSHGPAQIRQILKQIARIGNPKFAGIPEIYQLFPAEALFIGPNVEKSSFNNLDDIITLYKSEYIIVPEYAHHIHREHSPHHIYFRCKVSGWKWNLQPLSTENMPVQVYP